jgi:hypothetical protein
VTWQDDFDAAHAQAVSALNGDVATLAAKARQILATAETIGADALPILDGLVFVLETIPLPATHVAGAGLAALLVGARVLQAKFAGPVAALTTGGAP